MYFDIDAVISYWSTASLPVLPFSAQSLCITFLIDDTGCYSSEFSSKPEKIPVDWDCPGKKNFITEHQSCIAFGKGLRFWEDVCLRNKPKE